MYMEYFFRTQLQHFINKTINSQRPLKWQILLLLLDMNKIYYLLTNIKQFILEHSNPIGYKTPEMNEQYISSPTNSYVLHALLHAIVMTNH